MKQRVAKKYLIVGGEGHTTETLCRKVREEKAVYGEETRYANLLYASKKVKK